MEPSAPDQNADPPRKGRGKALFLLLGLLFLMAPGMLWWALPRVQGLWQGLSRYGELQWKRQDDWVDVTLEQAKRRSWPAGTAFLEPDWQPLLPGLELAELWLRRPPNVLAFRLLLVRADPASWRPSVAFEENFTGNTVSALAAAGAFPVAINASYFSGDGPVGLLMHKGVRWRPASKRWAAHFFVSPEGIPRVTNKKNADVTGVWDGIQGFPAIMSGGTTYPYLRYGGRGFDVGVVDRRSALCIHRKGGLLLLATDTLTNGLALAELATVLGGLGCVDAMGLDGGTSTGLFVHTSTRMESVPNLKPVPVIIGLRPD
ncbi:MAG TPA: phosphodiester glycosidase family protein [Myxococcota bacterium]|nr:phosphodiester glycosidase family protein [Myxococcota bacterium]